MLLLRAEGAQQEVLPLWKETERAHEVPYCETSLPTSRRVLWELLWTWTAGAQQEVLPPRQETEQEHSLTVQVLSLLLQLLGAPALPSRPPSRCRMRKTLPGWEEEP